MAIERKFTVNRSPLNGKYLVFAHGIGGPTAVAEAREEIFAETLASRLNEAYSDSFEELAYLLASGR